MSATDRAIRIACRAIVVLWIAAFLGWRDLAPREVRVAVTATALDAHELPPAPAATEDDAEPEAEDVAEAEAPAPEPEPEEVAEPEPEAIAEAEPAEPPAPPRPEPEKLREPEPQEIAAAEPPPAPPAPRAPAPAGPAPLAAAALPEPIAEPAPRIPEPPPQAPEPAPRALTEADRAPVAPGSERAPIAAPPLPLVAVDEADVARGGALLTGDAGFPTLESRYEGYGSFRDYARAMQRLGARFVVVDRREIVGTIDPWTLETGALGEIGRASCRERVYVLV